jgi:hypothetical protein
VGEHIDAKRVLYGAAEALALARKATEIYVIQGKNIIRVNMKTAPPPNDELLRLLLGRSGNLRAPTVCRGTTLIVGFDPDIYTRTLHAKAPKT